MLHRINWQWVVCVSCLTSFDYVLNQRFDRRDERMEQRFDEVKRLITGHQREHDLLSRVIGPSYGTTTK